MWRACGRGGACRYQGEFRDTPTLGVGGGAERAVDNAGCSGRWDTASCTHTDENQVGVAQWWRVDLRQSIVVKALTLVGRDIGADRTEGYSIFVGNEEADRLTDNAACVRDRPHLPGGSALEVACDQPVEGRYVYFYLPPEAGKVRVLTLCEVKVWGSVAAAGSTVPTDSVTASPPPPTPPPAPAGSTVQTDSVTASPPPPTPPPAPPGEPC